MKTLLFELISNVVSSEPCCDHSNKSLPTQRHKRYKWRSERTLEVQLGLAAASASELRLSRDVPSYATV